MNEARDRSDTRDHVLQAQHEQKLQALGLLAAAVAHDFNNHLTAILGHASILQESLPVEHPERDSVAEIILSSQQAAGLARQLLSFARAPHEEHAPVDLNEVARDAHSLLRRVIGVDVRLQLELAPSLAPVYGDASQIAQVLMNLIMNARDALPGGRGNVWIRTRHHAAESGRQRVDYSVIEVEDDGVGMDESVRVRVFEPFFSTKQQRQGTGLGMAIVQAIIERHDGRIMVDSSPGRGTRIRVLLPHAPRPAH